MAGFKKVMLTEKETAMDDSSAVIKQLDKFDNSYSSASSETNKKLENLYNEFDSITFNKSNTVSEAVDKDVAVATEKSSLKVKVYLTCAVLSTIMMLFLAIFNIFVIKNMNSSIAGLQTQEITQSAELDALIANNEELQNAVMDKVKNDFMPLDENSKIAIDLINTTKVESLSVESNWFDAICNFLSNLFK